MTRTRTLAAAVAVGLASLSACDFVGDENDEPVGATIGADVVPDGLRCEEDELIGYRVEGRPPYELGCVHVDGIR